MYSTLQSSPTLHHRASKSQSSKASYIDFLPFHQHLLHMFWLSEPYHSDSDFDSDSSSRPALYSFSFSIFNIIYMTIKAIRL